MATRALKREAPRREPAPRLRVVEGERKERKKPRRVSHVPVVCLVVLMVFGVAVLQAWVGQDGLRAAELERQVAHEQERLTLLRAQVAQLSSPSRLRAEALKFGMVPASDPRFLRVVVPAGAPGSTSAEAAKRLESPSP